MKNAQPGSLPSIAAGRILADLRQPCREFSSAASKAFQEVAPWPEAVAVLRVGVCVSDRGQAHRQAGQGMHRARAHYQVSFRSGKAVCRLLVSP